MSPIIKVTESINLLNYNNTLQVLLKQHQSTSTHDQISTSQNLNRIISHHILHIRKIYTTGTPKIG